MSAAEAEAINGARWGVIPTSPYLHVHGWGGRALCGRPGPWTAPTGHGVDERCPCCADRFLAAYRATHPRP